MKKYIESKLMKAFEAAGYASEYGSVVSSKRADFQCSGCLAASKKYGKAPVDIAKDVCEHLGNLNTEVAPQGFINIHISNEALVKVLEETMCDEYFGVDHSEKDLIMIDFGGANIAKPLHVGHLRSAIIGESIKRIYKFFGHEVIGDIHLGDWGLQMGLVIEALKEMMPEACYFDDAYEGEYPAEAPFTIDALSELYPKASAKSKEDLAFLNKARHNTLMLQKGHKGYRALWHHICAVSIKDLKGNYEKLNVHFDLWYGESHANSDVEMVLQHLKKQSLTKVDQGALIVPIEQDEDKKPMPPFIALKSDGAVLYHITDLTTIYQREKTYKPSEILYVVDKRQGLHFEQVFRVADMSGIGQDAKKTFLGFGTMNGKDGKPFKTRDGGVMKLEDLIMMLRQEVTKKMSLASSDYTEEEKIDIAMKVGLAALKYGDLCNIPSKDYIFDLDKFASFEGKTGPYLLYSIVRITSILNKADSFDKVYEAPITDTERALQMKMTMFTDALEQSYRLNAPNKLCDYLYELSTLFNRFYHETKILEVGNKHINHHLTMITDIKTILSKGLDLLGLDTLDKM